MLLSQLSPADLEHIYGKDRDGGGGPADNPIPPIRLNYTRGVAKPAGEPYTRMLVMGRLSSENVDWVDPAALNVNTTIYVVDDPEAENKVPQNKGRESMVYLTYIIDHYDDLSDTTMFFHPHLMGWHNNVLLGVSNAMQIGRLSDARVAREGYMNARCHHDPGCPDWLHIDRPESEWDSVKKYEERFLTSEVWRQLHGDTPIPTALSQPCCAQFAVSRERIRIHPRTRYEQLRDWLLHTELGDEVSGRILEYNWQFLFAGQSEYCPPMNECYCDGYGVCFGGPSELQEWLDTLKKREQADAELDALRKDGKADSPEAVEIGNRRDDLVASLEASKAEAYKTGEDPRVRAKEAGREFKEGDWF